MKNLRLNNFIILENQYLDFENFLSQMLQKHKFGRQNLDIL